MLQVLHVTENEDGTGDLVDVLYFDSLACIGAYLETHGTAFVSDPEGPHDWPRGMELDYPSYCAHCDALITDNSMTDAGVSYCLENLESWPADRVAEIVSGYDLRREAIREMTRRFRERYPDVGIPSAYRWATSWVDSLPERAELDWNESSGILTAEFERDGFQVFVRVESDTYAEPDGTFTDTSGPHTVEIPERYRDRDSYRFYDPLNRYVDHREGLSKLGYAKGPAHELASRYVREEMERNVREDRAVYVLSARAEREGIELGHVSIGGYEIDPDASYRQAVEEITQAIIECGLVDESIQQARDALAKLQAVS